MEEILFYGDDMVLCSLPDETERIYANPGLTPATDPDGEIRRALDEPLGMPRIEDLVNSRSRVVVAFDDPCVPVPRPLRDPRKKMVGQVLQRLFRAGVAPEKVNLICANGLHRKFRRSEIAALLGKEVMSAVPAGNISSHDGTQDLVRLGETGDGHEVDVNRLCTEADLTIYANVNFTTMNGGWKSLLVGLGSWESIRRHHNPDLWNGKDSIFCPQRSGMHRMLAGMGKVAEKKVRVFQMECVVDNRLWPGPLSGLLAPLGAPGRGDRPMSAVIKGALKASGFLPDRAKAFVRNSLRSGYRLCRVHAGQVDAVHEKTLALVFGQQNVAVEQQADIAVLGVPNLSPYAVGSEQNPILLRSLTLGYLAGAHMGKPLVREGGVIVALNPGREVFDKNEHPSYYDFWTRELPEHFDPELCWRELAEKYAADTRYLSMYRTGFAYHGTHSLMNWMWSGMALKSLSAVILAGAKEPATAEKMGFVPARDLSTALAMARERLGRDARIICPVIPPLFAVDVAPG
ncbi:MAG: lactate racemase domain-containing protein [Thermodesulfobacteriota bacterium]